LSRAFTDKPFPAAVDPLPQTRVTVTSRPLKRLG
jgi:hypothetical protein